jgi:UDPglucose 6-dehydrogenase
LKFTTDYPGALKDAEFAFIAVGTPSGGDGEADLQYVRSAAESIADNVDHPIVIINKSTVPVGTGDWVAEVVRKRRNGNPLEFSVLLHNFAEARQQRLQEPRPVSGSTETEPQPRAQL